MAYVNGKWLDRPARSKRIELLTERVKKLHALYKAGKASEHHIDTLLNDKNELKRLKRVHRAEVDNAYFAYMYLSDAENPESDDNIIRNADDGEPHAKLEDMALIHRGFFELCDEVDAGSGTNLGIAAPRGHSKSGIFSNAWLLKKLLYRDPSARYVLVISETDSLSKKLIGWINKILKYDAKIRADFGELMHTSATKNEKDNEEAFITTTNFLVEASSSNKQLRGKRHGALRPTTVLVDDPSSINNEGTKEARDKLISWFNSVVVPIGSKSTNIVLVGTMVSATGLLRHVLDRRDFKSSFHDAIVSEPDHPKAWEEYLEVYANSSKEAADDYYERNKPLLEAGTATAWEWRWTYRDLMHAKANMGTKDFNSEFRNRAFSEDEQYWNIDDLAYYTYKHNMLGERLIHFDDMDIRIGELTISSSWDIALGKNARSCFNACVTVGRHEPTGRIFVLDEYATKEQPHKFMEKIIDRIKEYKPRVFYVETINAQHEFFRQLQDELRRQGVYSTKVIDTKSYATSKDKRIEMLEPYTANRTLVFNRRHETLLGQMEQYPFGDYVDSIDSLQQSVEGVARAKKEVTEKPYWL